MDWTLFYYYFQTKLKTKKTEATSNEKPTGEIDLTGSVCCQLPDRRDMPNLFGVGHELERLYILSAATPKEKEEWLSALKVWKKIQRKRKRKREKRKREKIITLKNFTWTEKWS